MTLNVNVTEPKVMKFKFHVKNSQDVQVVTTWVNIEVTNSSTVEKKEPVKNASNFAEMMKTLMRPGVYESTSGFQTNRALMAEMVRRRVPRQLQPWEYVSNFSTLLDEKFFCQKIKEVSRSGEVTIEFNTEVYDESMDSNITKTLNASVLDIKLKISDETLTKVKEF